MPLGAGPSPPKR